jgi:cell division septation protein DedD
VTAYWVQVGAFRNVEKAIQVLAALRDQAVSLVTAPAQPLMRVLVGPFTDRTVAVSKLREIRARGYAAFIAEAAE